MSLRGRLLAASLALLTVALAVAGVATYFALRSFLLDRINHQLDSVDRSSEAALSTPGVGVGGPLLGRLLAVSAPGYYVELRNSQGRVLAHWQAQGEVPTPQPLLPVNLQMPTQQGSPGDHASAKYLTVPSAVRGVPSYQVRVSGVTLADDGSIGALIVALPLTDVRGTLARLIGVEILVGIAVLAAAGAIGSWLVRLGLKPLVEIEETAARIAAGDLTERVARSDDYTEVGQLGRALNVMLARIEAAFDERRASEAALRTSEERLRRFVSDASHELRTPVASVRAYAELFRRGGDRHPEDLPRLMARIESEAARMGVLVEDLLLLTRLDQGRPLEMAPVDLGALAADSVEAARTIDPDRPLTLQVEGSVEVMGDRDRLRQVTDNLLANVRTHTPPGAGASVTVRLAGGRAIIEVADTGPGIDPVDTEHIFERFFRSDRSRARDRGGSGLGLSIVAAIAAAHGGSASATNRPGPGGGALITIDLPALVEPPAKPPSDDGTQEEGPDPEVGPEAWAPAPEAGQPEQPPQPSGLIRT